MWKGGGADERSEGSVGGKEWEVDIGEGTEWDVGVQGE